MKRLLLVLAMLLVVCASFSNALIEAASVRCEEVEHTIGRLSLPWKAGVPAILNEFAANGFSDLDSVIEKWNGTLRWIEPG
ncbi:MAG: hypothetical protein JW701_05305, partial [Kosmotogaceae bacterium]|nr:hypothetical protein [Kosmotogaceae bacterium]